MKMIWPIGGKNTSTVFTTTVTSLEYAERLGTLPNEILESEKTAISARSYLATGKSPGQSLESTKAKVYFKLYKFYPDKDTYIHMWSILLYIKQ